MSCLLFKTQSIIYKIIAQFLQFIFANLLTPYNPNYSGEFLVTSQQIEKDSQIEFWELSQAGL